MARNDGSSSAGNQVSRKSAAGRRQRHSSTPMPISARSAVSGIEHRAAGQVVELRLVAAAGDEELEHFAIAACPIRASGLASLVATTSLARCAKLPGCWRK